MERMDRSVVTIEFNEEEASRLFDILDEHLPYDDLSDEDTEFVSDFVELLNANAS